MTERLRERQRVSEDLDRGEVLVALTRSVVECEGDHVAARLSDVLHRSALRQVLSNETVGVLVDAAFPGAIGSGEVERRTRGSFDVAIAMEFGSVVDGDRFEQSAMSTDQLNDTAVCGGNRSGSEPAE